jgi:hypothetical protein
MINNIWTKLRGLNDNGVLDSLLLLGGNLIWVDGYIGSDMGYGTKDQPLATLKEALLRARPGHNDIVVIKNSPGDAVNSGATAAMCSTYLDANLDWNKACTHLVAQNPNGSFYSPRARISVKATTAAFANFFTLSARGCMFHNIEFIPEWTLDAGIAAEICVAVTGANNRFGRCQFGGMYGATSAASATSRALYVSGGENLFEDCVLGLDTVKRSGANSSLQLHNTGKCVFRRNHFIMWSNSTDSLHIVSTNLQRFNYFEDCIFENWPTTQAGIATLAAGLNGKLAFKNCMIIGASGYGTDATTRGQEIITGPTDGSTISGVGYVPTA